MKSTKAATKKWSAYCGGGASFYLADAQGKGVIVEAKTKGAAIKEFLEMLTAVIITGSCRMTLKQTIT